MTDLTSKEVPFTFGAQLDARAGHAEISGRIAIRDHDRSWTYLAFRDESVRYARFLIQRLGAVDERRPGHVAMLMENHRELLALYAACGYAGFTLFGINTGLRGDTLAGVLAQSGARLLVVDERFLPEVERIAGKLGAISRENVLVLRGDAAGSGTLEYGSDLAQCLAAEVGAEGLSLDTPAADVEPTSNLTVIYTSGTTGLPKGINNNHFKVLAIGHRVSERLGLSPDDVGYACMPLFHSNALFLGFHPAFNACGTTSMRERFSASRFVPDVLRYGVTYWNYVGEPVHYILGALEREYGEDAARRRAEVTENPSNRLRYAIGNGASPPDIDRFTEWLGLEDMLELYGSTEAAISTIRDKHSPRGSVGELTDPAVVIVSEEGRECPAAQLDAAGKITNYSEAVGEICRVAPDTALFQGYYDNARASAQKYRDGVYHSGDLGHVLEKDGKRFLYFDGRTEDWIRKDGENFSAAQVARMLQEHADVVLVAAYGVPCAVSDELVMAALKLRDGVRFDPAEFYDFCERQVESGGMDRKWFPDFVRVVSDFEYTGTQKILVRNLKAEHFDRRRLADAELYWRRREDERFKEFGAAEYQALRREFEASERSDPLDR